MILTAKEIAEITRLLDDSHFSELRLEIGEFRLRISRGGASLGGFADEEPFRAPAIASSAAKAAAAPPAPAVTQATAATPGEVDVPAPLLGNFYQAPRPGDPPFVKPGDVVAPETTIGIIEVMKLMNPIRAGIAGTVIDYVAANGSSVEEGQALLRVRAG